MTPGKSDNVGDIIDLGEEEVGRTLAVLCDSSRQRDEVADVCGSSSRPVNADAIGGSGVASTVVLDPYTILVLLKTIQTNYC